MSTKQFEELQHMGQFINEVDSKNMQNDIEFAKFRKIVIEPDKGQDLINCNEDIEQTTEQISQIKTQIEKNQKEIANKNKITLDRKGIPLKQWLISALLKLLLFWLLFEAITWLYIYEYPFRNRPPLTSLLIKLIKGIEDLFPNTFIADIICYVRVFFGLTTSYNGQLSFAL